MHIPSIPPEKNTRHNASVLATLFTQEMTLFIKTKYLHWIACQAHTIDLGKLLEYQILQLELTIGKLAGRINTPCTMQRGIPKDYKDLEAPGEIPEMDVSQNGMLVALLKDHESLMQLLRTQVSVRAKKSGDPLPAGFLIGTLEGHESAVWTLRKQLVQNSGSERLLRRKQSNE